MGQGRSELLKPFGYVRFAYKCTAVYGAFLIAINELSATIPRCKWAVDLIWAEPLWHAVISPIVITGVLIHDFIMFEKQKVYESKRSSPAINRYREKILELETSRKNREASKLREESSSETD